MQIIKIETTLIPQTLEGQQFADEYQDRLQRQNAFCGRKEDTQYISIKAQYFFEFRGEA